MQVACLVNSEKDKAENLMIVDMIRNDLGKIVVTGSISVDGLFEQRGFAHGLAAGVQGFCPHQREYR